MINMELNKVVISENSEEQVIVLKEIDGARAFPIVIGISEALAINRGLHGKPLPRPMTHNLIENVIKGLDARLESIIVSELRERTFYAKLVLRRNGKTHEVDARPSDAIALAVQMRVPIYVEDAVLDEVMSNPAESDPPDLPAPDEDDEV